MVDAIWTTREIVTAVVGTGVISAFASSALTWIGDIVRFNSRSKRDKTYLCMRVTSALEAYAIRCAEIIEAADAHYGQTKSPLIISLPEPPVYPHDIEWNSIDSKIAYRLMSFLNEYEARAADARHVSHFEGNPFDVQEAARSTGKKAYELANVLRGVASLSPPDLGRVLTPLFK
ncbi:hypothetical protein [Pararhizobium sp. DWP1-1-3]|uniref:hypothetical protein n=1 Tax=Pararhizobium sp. DWP1-1-3 TaxID=2804652 RepID=UPI003CEC8B58